MSVAVTLVLAALGLTVLAGGLLYGESIANLFASEVSGSGKARVSGGGKADHYRAPGERTAHPTPEKRTTAVPSTAEDEVFFPRHEEGEVPATLAGGRLALDDEGCIRLVTARNRSRATLIWPPTYAARAEAGEIRILDEGGRVVARVGDEVRIGGGFIGKMRALEGISGVNEQTKRELIQRCPGEYFYAAPYISPIRGNE